MLFFTHAFSRSVYICLCKTNRVCFQICVLAHAMLKITDEELEIYENFHCDLEENHDILLYIFLLLRRILAFW